MFQGNKRETVEGTKEVAFPILKHLFCLVCKMEAEMCTLSTYWYS